MVTTTNEIIVANTVIDHWWQNTRRDHRLHLRLMQEKPENLQKMPYIELVIKSLDRTRTKTLRQSYPKTVREVRSYLVSSQRNFIECLNALQQNNLIEATIHYERAWNDLTLLQYIFMEHGVQSYI